MSARALIALALVLGHAARAQERPAEEDMFGEPAPATEPAPDAGAAPATDAAADAGREQDIFGGEPAQPSTPPPPAHEVAPEDPLKIGGQFYLRASASTPNHSPWTDTRLSVPMLVDGYFDARPNERVRGYVLGRLSFDPSIDPGGTSLPGTAPPQNPRVVLDQMWLKFDVGRALYVTLGKQHVKWGAGRFWTPTDYLHGERRDPLALFDVRTGTTMLKLHLPWEEQGWNFYAVALFDNYEPADLIDRVGGAARAEFVIGTAELGVDAVVQQFRNPRFGADLSAGLGPIDLTADVGFREEGDTHRWREVLDPDPALGILGEYESYLPTGWTAAASVGARTEIQISDTDSIALGAEYFYNHSGYDDANIYPWLIFKGDYQPFYTGRHYAGLYGYIFGPGDFQDLAIIFSTLGNLSDGSFVSRLDVTNTFLTHLRVEVFAAVHYGTEGGEFRLKLDIPPVTVGTQSIPPIFVPAPLFDLGVALRINI